MRSEYEIDWEEFNKAKKQVIEELDVSLKPILDVFKKLAENLKNIISECEEQCETQKEKDRKVNKAVIQQRKKTVYKLNNGYKNNNIRTSSYYLMSRKRK